LHVSHYTKGDNANKEQGDRGVSHVGNLILHVSETVFRDDSVRPICECLECSGHKQQLSNTGQDIVLTVSHDVPQHEKYDCCGVKPNHCSE
jgi:hypothetical protein